MCRSMLPASRSWRGSPAATRREVPGAGRRVAVAFPHRAAEQHAGGQPADQHVEARRGCASAALRVRDLPLNPPTASEARRFVRARLPHLSAAQQDALVQSSGRSFEELRTLTLLAELREPVEGSDGAEHLRQLIRLADNATDPVLREFLAILAVLAPAEFPSFPAGLLAALREDSSGPDNLELAFLDPVPGREGTSGRSRGSWPASCGSTCARPARTSSGT